MTKMPLASSCPSTDFAKVNKGDREARENKLFMNGKFLSLKAVHFT